MRLVKVKSTTIFAVIKLMFRNIGCYIAIAFLALTVVSEAQVFRDYTNHWLLRTFETNLQKCSRRDNVPDWCSEWVEAMEGVMMYSTNIEDPEWKRMAFKEGMIICSSFYPPAWCSDWHDAMNNLTVISPYKDNVNNYANRIAAEKAFREAEENNWKDIVKRVSAKDVTNEDIAVLERLANEGEFRALEVLAWMNAAGAGVKVDLARSYELYGRAYLDGHTEVKANMDKLWPQLSLEAKKTLSDRFK